MGIVLATACVTAGLAAAPLSVKVGFAETDITPDIGMECPGGYGKSFHQSVHDPCKVRAAVFDDGTKQVAIVGVDALVVPAPLVASVRARIRARCGIAPEAILVAASHSHSSGPTGMVLPGEYDHASPLVRSLAYEKSSCADPKYLARVEEGIVAAVAKAFETRTEALCGVGKGIEARAAFNRRFRMKNGLTYTHPGQGNPDIIDDAGPTDPEVGVLAAWDKDGKLAGCIVNYACHATTSPGGISANYIYYIEQVIRGAFGPAAIVVFLPGASGDVTQVDNLSPVAHPDGERWARILGGRVGAEAVKVLLTMERGSLAPLDARRTVLRIPRRKPRPERIRECLEIVAKDPAQVGHTPWTFAKEIVLLDAILARAPVAEVEVQAVQVGPAIFLGNPAEFFCRLGLDIKAGSPFPFTFPVTFANGTIGYVPTEEAFGPNGGGYETRLTAYSNLEIGAGGKIVEAAIALARAMTPGAVPSAPPAPPFREPWSYGNVPPERE